MKTKTLILCLIICSLCFVVDGYRYSKDESGSDRFGRKYDDGNRSALSQKPGSKRNRSSSRVGKINGSDGEEKNFPEGDPPERDSDEDNEDGPPGRGPHPRRGPSNFDGDDNGNGDDKPSNYGRGSPRRGPPSFDDDDESANFGRRPQRRGPPSFDNEDYGNDGDKIGNYRNGPPRRMPHRYGNSERDGYEKIRFWQRPSDSSDDKTNNPDRGQPGGGYNRGFNPGYDGRDGEGGNEKLRKR